MQHPVRRAVAVISAVTLALGCSPPAVSGPGTGTVDNSVDRASAQGPAQPTTGHSVDAAGAEIVTALPDSPNPVVVAAALRPAKVRPGETVVFFVQARIAPTWHIYQADGPPGEAIPTILRLGLPTGVEASGSWVYPKATPAAEGRAGLYEGTVTFRRQLRVTAGAPPGPLEVSCEFGYQACDPFSCRPPAKLVLKAGAEIVVKD